MADPRNHYHHQASSPVPTIPSEEELASSFRVLSTEDHRQYGSYGGASNTVLRPPSSSPSTQSFTNGTMSSPNHVSTHRVTNGTMSTPNHIMNGFASPFIASGSYPNMGSQVSLDNSYVNSVRPRNFENFNVSAEPFSSLTEQARNDYQIRKIINDDPTLLDEVNAEDIRRMGCHKLGRKYLLKFLSNEVEKPRLMRLISWSESFKALVVVIASEVHTRLGSRVMQNIIKLSRANPLMVGFVLLVLKPNLVSVMLNQNGSQLIQNTLQLCRYGHYQPLVHIYEIAVQHCLELATTEQGVFTLKAIIESIQDPLKSQLLAVIINDAIPLSGHCYGNFIVQHVFDHHPYTVGLICNELKGNLFVLSKDKYGSRVVEKCVLSNAINVVVSHFLSDEKQLVEIAQDMFGNYVVQKALQHTRGQTLRDLVDILRKCKRELENHPNGRNVYRCVRRLESCMGFIE